MRYADHQPSINNCPVCGQMLDKIDEIIFDKERLSVRHGSNLFLFTTMEFYVFETLCKANGNLVTREKLMFSLYGNRDYEPEQRIIDVYIFKLRKKLEGSQLGIRTIYGQGWGLVRNPDLT